MSSQICKRQISAMARANHQMSLAIFLFVVLASHLLSHGFVDGSRIPNKKNRITLVKHEKKNTIVSDDGQIIDCVDIYKQPAFSHPLLRNHTIQMKPSSYPRGLKLKARSLNSSSNDELLQGWLKNGRCPEGTIPILRTQEPNLLPRKTAAFIPHMEHLNQSQLDDTITTHEYAQVSSQIGTYYGAHAQLNVWNPATLEGEISIAQIWVLAGQDNDLNTVEAGWMIPSSGIKKTKLFVFWTADNYQGTGCYNLQCPGFVQTSKKFAFNYNIEPLSIYGGKQYEIGITIHKDMKSGNWWLHSQGQDIGYWPQSIFTSLTGSARVINWGGEIVNSKPLGHHTTTKMGSGHFPSEGPNKASFFRDLRFIDNSGALRPPENLLPYVSNPNCYDLRVMNKNSWGAVHFYYGGPGFSDKCP